MVQHGQSGALRRGWTTWETTSTFPITHVLSAYSLLHPVTVSTMRAGSGMQWILNNYLAVGGSEGTPPLNRTNVSLWTKVARTAESQRFPPLNSHEPWSHGLSPPHRLWAPLPRPTTETAGKGGTSHLAGGKEKRPGGLWPTQGAEREEVMPRPPPPKAGC